MDENLTKVSRKIIGVILGMVVFAIFNLFGAVGMIVGLFLGLGTYNFVSGDKTKSFNLKKTQYYFMGAFLLLIVLIALIFFYLG